MNKQDENNRIHALMHELRNPINAISVGSELGAILASQQELDGEKIQELFRDILRQCQDMAISINKLNSIRGGQD